MKKITLILLTILSLSCSSVDDKIIPCANLLTSGIQISTNLTNSSLAYLTDGTNETCTNYITAAESYIEYSNNVLDCLPAIDQAELEEEIQNLKAEIAQLDCI